MILLASLAFAYLLYDPSRGAERHLAAERAAIQRLRSADHADLASPDPYRLAWVREGTLPPVLVASPGQEQGGLRWFVATEGREIYEFDTVRFAVKEDRPDVESLRRWLARKPEERKDEAPPHGWSRVK